MTPAVTVDSFLRAIAHGDTARASELLSDDPGLAAASLHVAAALGDDEAVRRHLAGGARVDASAGDPPGEPLLWLCYSPFHGERDDELAAAARALLDAGADPNTRDGGPYKRSPASGHQSLPTHMLLTRARKIHSEDCRIKTG